MNIELEHSVAKLRKENETLKHHYKDLYDSIKIMRSKTTEQTTSLLANNAELKGSLRKGFAIAALINNLWKLKEHSIDTKISATADDGKPKPRSNNQTSRSLLVSKSSRVTITALPKADHSKSPSSFSDSKCHKCVFNANHDACITKLLKEVNSRAKIQSHKIRDSNKPVDQKNHTQKSGRQIFTGHRKVIRIFATSRFDIEPPHGSNVDILNIHECKQTLDVSADDDTEKMTFDYNRSSLEPQCQMTFDKNGFKPRTTMSTEVHQAAETVTTSNELDLLFGPLFDEYFNGENQVVLKSSAVTTTDASNKRQQQPVQNFIPLQLC
ncbi:hypothetical protein Tco_0520155 [Tanacetum coccineum]